MFEVSKKTLCHPDMQSAKPCHYTCRLLSTGNRPAARLTATRSGIIPPIPPVNLHSFLELERLCGFYLFFWQFCGHFSIFLASFLCS